MPVDRRKRPRQEATDSRFLADGRDLHQDQRQVGLLFRAVAKFRKSRDFMPLECRDEAAAAAFFAREIGSNGFPDRVVIDKSGANLVGL